MKLLGLGLLTGSLLLAQFGTATVPFVGCATFGQFGEEPAPAGSPMDAAASPDVAAQLAYYKAAEGDGVLAPRGWQCVATYGAGTMLLVVMPEVDLAAAKAGTLKIAGPAVAMQSAQGLGPVSLTVARMVARLFPAKREWAESTFRAYKQPEPPGTPYPHDVVRSDGEAIVLFRTPANEDGFGAELFGRSADPIDGVAMLLGEDGLVVQVRLPEAMRRLTTSILKQVEQDVASRQW